MSNKKSKDNSFDLLHQLDRKLQKSKSNRENNQNKPKESRPSASESRKRRSLSPYDKGFTNSKRSKKKASTSVTPVIEIDNDIDYDIPDRSLGDFFCKLCDAHMNSQMAWDTHIQGKRHLKSLKRGDLDLKYDTLDEDPQIFPEIKNAVEPIIGLNHCCEFQRLEGRPTYQCFLCSSNVPNGKALIEHLSTAKHMMAYMKEHDTAAHKLIADTQLTKGMLEPIIKDLALKHWKKHGMGKMQVKKERLKPPPPSYYKPTYKDDFSHKKPRDDRRNEYSEWDKNDSNWRRLKDTENDYYRQRSLTPPQSSYRDDYLDSPSRHYDRYREPYDHNVSRQYSPRADYNYPLTDPVSSYDKSDLPSSSKLPFSRDRGDTSLVTQQTVTYPISSQSQYTDIRSEDLRLFLDQKRTKEANKPETSKPEFLEYIKKLLDIISSLPEEIFLELVRIRMDQMENSTSTISDASTALLKSVGNTMLSIVMNRKIKEMSPEMFNKFVDAVKCKTSEPEPMIKPVDVGNKSSNLNDLMKLIAQLKSTPLSTSTPTTKPFSADSTQKYSTVQNIQHIPVFSTEMSSIGQSLFSHQPNTSVFTYETKGIPGLTLSEASSSTYQLFEQNNSASEHQSPFPHKPQDPIGTKTKNNSWPSSDYHRRY